MFWIALTIAIIVALMLRKTRPRMSEKSSNSAALSRRDAAAILGIHEHATTQDIHDAHHRLMKKLHPDQGGSDYLSQQINQARDRLLKP